ncbi:hypothetical protein QYE76_029461 [Lolium multiflorum]|uniref:DUF4216 domain-containing protein n=1 Tax=Lolium multiflorum TaxID=4521 RepID=A0AAD8QRG6_LOLMU|nr:hypothetical protein QYE76_029461 [Lolium multiflorum]
MGVLKKYVHNRARPEGSISKGYGTEEVIEFCVDFIPDLKPIGVPESRYEGRLRGKGTLGKKSATCMDGHSFTQAHYTVLLNSILVAPYKEEHKEILRSKYPEQREDWIDGEHMKTFGGWLQTRLMNVTDDEQLYLLAKQPSSTISTFQGYEINGNTFYTFAQDKKSTNQNSGVRFDAEDGNGNKVTYYGYIEEIWELDYEPNFKVPLFRCKWFNLKDGVQVDPQYGMTTVDFKNLGLISANLIILSHGFHRISNPREAEALCASNYPCPPGYRVPTGWLLSVGGVPVPPVPLGVAREMAITNHYYFELTPEQRRNPHRAAIFFSILTLSRACAFAPAAPAHPRRAAIRATPRRPQPRGRRRRRPRQGSPPLPRPSSLPARRRTSGVGAAGPPHHAPPCPASPRTLAFPTQTPTPDDAKPHSAAVDTTLRVFDEMPPTPMPPRCRCRGAARRGGPPVPRHVPRRVPSSHSRVGKCQAVPAVPRGAPLGCSAAVPARRHLPVPLPRAARMPLARPPCPCRCRRACRAVAFAAPPGAAPARGALPLPCPCRCRALPCPCRCRAAALPCPAVPLPCRCRAAAVPCRAAALPQINSTHKSEQLG